MASDDFGESLWVAVTVYAEQGVAKAVRLWPDVSRLVAEPVSRRGRGRLPPRFSTHASGTLGSSGHRA